MQSDNFNISTYFKRINYTGPAGADTATLHALMRHQLFSVPFENLSVRAGEPIPLEEEALFEKIVVRRRGGFCYELNGPFPLRIWTYRRAKLSRWRQTISPIRC